MRYPDFDSLRSDYFRSVVSGHVNSAISLGYSDIFVVYRFVKWESGFVKIIWVESVLFSHFALLCSAVESG